MPSFLTDDATTLTTVPDGYFSHILTSPPYNLKIDYGPYCNDDKSPDDYRTFAHRTAATLKRVATPTAILGLVVAYTNTLPLPDIWRTACEQAGWTFVGEIVIRKPGTHLWTPRQRDPVHHYRSVRELLLCFTADGTIPTWSRACATTVWDIPSHGFPWHHAAFSPLLPDRWLTLVEPPSTATILDPFCGTGTTVVVAQQRGYAAIGVDINPTYVLEAAKRLAKTPHPTIRHGFAIPRPTIPDQLLHKLPPLIPYRQIAPWFGKKPTNRGSLRNLTALPGFTQHGGRFFFRRDITIPYLLDMGLTPHDPPTPPSIDPNEFYTYQDLLRILGRDDTGHRRRYLMKLCPGFAKIGRRSYWKKTEANPWLAARLTARPRASRGGKSAHRRRPSASLHANPALSAQPFPTQPSPSHPRRDLISAHDPHRRLPTSPRSPHNSRGATPTASHEWSGTHTTFTDSRIVSDYRYEQVASIINRAAAHMNSN
jgi:hypothetical protein